MKTTTLSKYTFTTLALSAKLHHLLDHIPKRENHRFDNFEKEVEKALNTLDPNQTEKKIHGVKTQRLDRRANRREKELWKLSRDISSPLREEAIVEEDRLGREERVLKLKELKREIDQIERIFNILRAREELEPKTIVRFEKFFENIHKEIKKKESTK